MSTATLSAPHTAVRGDNQCAQSIARPTTIAVVGAGDLAQSWSRALRSVDGTEIRRFLSASDENLIAALTDQEVAAAVFALRDGDASAAAKHAILSRCHVLVAGGLGLGSRQLLALDELARGRGATFVFDASGYADDAVAFARRMMRGETPIWRSKYVRAHRNSSVASSLDHLALIALGRVLALCEGLPEKVSALATRTGDETGTAESATIALGFEGGFLARLDVSLVEAQERDELTIVCEGRTVAMNASHNEPRLSVCSTSHADRNAPRALTIEHPPVSDSDPVLASAEAFVTSVREGARESNAREMAAATLVWEIARDSMASGGDPLPLPVNHPLSSRQRPALHVIEGGGQPSAEVARPRLRLVQGGRSAVEENDPPRSA